MLGIAHMGHVEADIGRRAPLSTSQREASLYSADLWSPSALGIALGVERHRPAMQRAVWTLVPLVLVLWEPFAWKLCHGSQALLSIGQERTRNPSRTLLKGFPSRALLKGTRRVLVPFS
jgi:hypothetical protein